MKSFRAWSHAPRTTTYVPSPPPQTVRKRTPTELSDDMVPDLMARMQEWNGEVARLEREVESFEPSNLKDHLAFHMFSGKIKNHERFWDPKGDGVRTSPSRDPYLYSMFPLPPHTPGASALCPYSPIGRSASPMRARSALVCHAHEPSMCVPCSPPHVPSALCNPRTARAARLSHTFVVRT